MMHLYRVGTPARTKTSEVTNVASENECWDLEDALPTLLKGRRGKDVQVVVALSTENYGGVAVYISKRLKPFVDRPFLNYTRSSIYQAYQAALSGRPRAVENNPELSDTEPMGPVQNPIPSEDGSSATPVARESSSLSHDGPTQGATSPEASCLDTEICEPPQPTVTDRAATPDEQPMPRMQKMKSFRIRDEVKVTAFFEDRLEKIQQLSDKRIAKAWIKGICPKKQAKFPYQNKQRQRELGLGPEVPIWWPKGCEFKEPDHIQKEPRKKLLLHLLRLRPTPEDLKSWNNDMAEPNPTHVTRGWTAFLRELAPLDSVDAIDNGKPDKVKKRREYMKDLYDVAEMEEDFQTCGMGGDQLFHYPDDAKPSKPYKSKRPRPSISAAMSMDDESQAQPDSSLPSNFKRIRLNSDSRPTIHRRLAKNIPIFPVADGDMTEVDGPQSSNPLYSVSPLEMDLGLPSLDMSPTPGNQAALANDAAASEQPQNGIGTGEPWNVSPEEMTAQQLQQQQQQQQIDTMAQQQVQWHTTQLQSSTESLGSTAPDSVRAFNTYSPQAGAQSMFPGRHDHPFEPYPHHGHDAAAVVVTHQQMIHMPQLTQAPQPQFETVLHTPPFSPASLMYGHGMNGAIAVQQATMPAPPAFDPSVNYHSQFTYQSTDQGQPKSYGPHPAETFPHGCSRLPLQETPQPLQQNSLRYSAPAYSYPPQQNALGFQE